MRSRRTTGSTRSGRSTRGRSRSISSRRARTCSRSARPARRSGSSRSSRRRAACCSRRTRSPASAGARSIRAPARARAPRSPRPRRASRTSTSSSRVDTADGTFTVETPRRCAGRRRPPRRRRGRRRHLQLLAARRRPPRRRARDRGRDRRRAGPVRAALEVAATYAWPVAAGRRPAVVRTTRGRRPCRVRCATRLELRTDERFLRVHTEIDNQARDHRLRVHCPLPAPVTGSDADCAFAVVRRGLTAEGGPHEAGLPTFVSRRFVDCADGTAGLALLHDGLLEYEVVADGRGLALTLLRAVGYLSRVEPALRPNPAGPMDALEGRPAPGTPARRLRAAAASGRLAGRRSLRGRRRVPRAARAGAGRRDHRRRPRRRAGAQRSTAPRCPR